MSATRSLVIAFCLLLSFAGYSDVYINEILASNATIIEDADGDFSDWIELHNDGDELVDLDGWSLTDGGKNERHWVFPSVVIQPDGYLIIWASAKDRRTADELHANFELKKSGESISLRDSSGVIRSEITYPPQYSDLGWGLRSDSYRFFTNPTPGSSNHRSNAYVGVLPTPELSESGRWFDQSLTISVKNRPDGASIDYLASREGLAYEGAGHLDESDSLTITSTTILRIAFVKEGWLSAGTSTTATYLRLEDILTQTRPPTFPEFWHDGIPADYDMDPILLDTEEERIRLQIAMSALPTLSLVTTPDNLFAKGGIYTNPMQDGPSWESPVSMEWFGDERTPPFQVDTGIQIQGRSSRQPRTSPKHSFRVVFKKRYGPAELQHPIFEDDSADAEHNTLVLRATSNHSWTYPVAEQRQRAQYLRDPWVKATQAAMGHRVPRSRFAHLFLNGLYWGVYAISERPDDAFMATHFGGKRSAYDVIKGGEVIAGNNRVWRRLFALANQGLDDPKWYAELTNYIDLDSFIDFIILNHFIGNETWDFGNWYAARRRGEGHRFQFFCWDAETSMNRVNENRVFTRNADRPTALFQALRRNADFRDRYSARLNLHLTETGALTPTRNIERYQTLAEKLEVPLFAESVRWGDYRLSVHPYRTGPFERYTVDAHWQAERSRLTEVYFRDRTSIVLQQYRDLDL
ncbi:MAG: CotH kinase family protein [Candidatus Hydrogenedentota bacterium]